jgi:nitrogen fixation-related uncharacterized protein
MYFPYFITYMVAGFVLSILVFVWALHAGQFKDQQRARFLPLDGELNREPVRVSRLNRIEGYALLLLACLGLMASGATLLFSLVAAG